MIRIMDARDVIAILRNHERDLRARGVRHSAVFGSVARGTAGPDSDIDILIEIEEGAQLDLFAYAGLKRAIAGLFEEPVDVIDRAALKPPLRAPAERDAIYAF